MLTTIGLSNVATYQGAGASMSALQRCNFVYGPNGAGKSTIARFLREPNHADFAGCSAQWNGGHILKVVVYNREFVDQTFNGEQSVKGIFTLGSEDGAIVAAIQELQKNLKAEEEKASGLTLQLSGVDGNGGRKKELEDSQDVLQKACWAQFRKHDSDFSTAFKGARNDGKVFLQRCLSERISNQSELADLEDMKVRAKSVYVQSTGQVAKLAVIPTAALKGHESTPLLGKAIVGRNDVDIAQLIRNLQNSDWVSQGLKYLEVSKPACPFCQQDVPAGLEEQFAAFFDESFKQNIVALETFAAQYGAVVDSINAALDVIESAPSDFFDLGQLKALHELFDAKATIAKDVIARKQREPSSIVMLEKAGPALDDINSFLDEANKKITAHNEMVANRATEQSRLTGQVWRYLIDVELKDALAAHDQVLSTTGKAVQIITEKLANSNTEQKKLAVELAGKQKHVTSTQPTVDAINASLTSFNFANFKLVPGPAKNTYQLVRPDGSLVRSTLSEGERTLIAFLYFYHLAQASDSEMDISQDRVVVLDDPVSSLDSDILFVVSSLVRDIADRVREGQGSIRQLLVLTHNIFFHKELAFCTTGQPKTTNFWTVRKRGGLSEIVPHGATNPVKSSYELLWHDVRKPEGCDATLPNTMRRILESYFKLLGGIDNHKIAANFLGMEKIACHALLSWANDGSHGVHDDLSVMPAGASLDLYKKVFRGIFENEGHPGHYRMMMSDAFVELPPVPAPTQDAA